MLHYCVGVLSRQPARRCGGRCMVPSCGSRRCSLCPCCGVCSRRFYDSGAQLKTFELSVDFFYFQNSRMRWSVRRESQLFSYFSSMSFITVSRKRVFFVFCFLFSSVSTWNFYLYVAILRASTCTHTQPCM